MKLSRFAAATASLTFLLLILGGLVHNTRSSLACPDWPLCFGQVFPRMVGGVLVEHSHRLVATTVGVLTIVLLIGLVRRASRTGDTRLGWLGAAALACVCVQGGLGGLTVIFRLPTWTSTTHLAVSMIFFCLIIYIAFRARPLVPSNEPRRALPSSVRRWTLAATALVYAQMILGALMRHLGAGLACVEVPLCKGQLFPTGAHVYVQIHMLHRALAIVTFGVVLTAAIVTFRAARGRAIVRALAIAAPLLVAGQVALGLWSIVSFLDALPVTMHLAFAAAILADLWCLHLISRGELAPATARREIPVDGSEVAA